MAIRWQKYDKAGANSQMTETEGKSVIKCTIWKIGDRTYRITVNDIRYRKLDTACICDIDALFTSMEEIKEAITSEQNVTVVFETMAKP